MAEMQAGYEKRIAYLRAEFDRATNQQVLDQKKIQQKLDTLLQRQAALEQHQRGFLDQAAQLFPWILVARPDEVDALHRLGVVAHPQCDHVRAAQSR